MQDMWTVSESLSSVKVTATGQDCANNEMTLKCVTVYKLALAYLHPLMFVKL